MDKQTGQFTEAYGSVSFLSSQGFEVQGTPVHLGFNQVTFELVTPNRVIRTSEVLNEFRLKLRARTAYLGRATVTALTQTGTQVVCVVSLDEGWMEGAMPAEKVQGSEVIGAFEEFLGCWEKYYSIDPEFKVVVADMQTFLADLRFWMERVELGLPKFIDERKKVEQEVLENLGDKVTRVLNHFFEKFELLARKAEERRKPAFRLFARRQLHPWLLSAPFLYRTFSKPLGYAGDYEMVNMISREPFEGETLFAKLVNLWFLVQPPAEAHRNRLTFLEGRISEAIMRASSEGRRAKILNLACGPAVEVQRFIQNYPHADRADFVLLDFNDETIANTRERIQQIKQAKNRSASVQFVKKSVNQVLKEASRSAEPGKEGEYDLVYCAGLFDYLTDAVCRRLSTHLYTYVRPGGVWVSTNVHVSNPWPLVMDMIMDWHLIYRTTAQMAAVRPEQTELEHCKVTTDMSGVNIYLEARKPEL